MQRTLYLVLFFTLSSALRTQVTPGNNVIAVDVSTYHVENSSIGYDVAFQTGVELGMTEVGVFFNWTMIEVQPGVFDYNLLDIVNLYYPAQGIDVDLNLNPINTNVLEVPSDLANINFDDPLMIARYNALLDSVKLHLPDVSLSSLVIGSEIGAYLGNDQEAWMKYKTFYDSTSTHARSLWPGIKIAVELQYPDLINYNDYAQDLNENSDYIGVSFYPMNADFTVQPDYMSGISMDTLVDLYPDKLINYYQYGYPTSALCGSSEQLQADFIASTFFYWDYFASHIRMIDFTWINDLDQAAVDFYADYYGFDDPTFLEFLRTIGLRTWEGDGTDKLGLEQLRCEARSRGFNTLDLDCISAIHDEEMGEISVYPIPAHDDLYLLSDEEILSLTLLDLCGRTMIQNTQYTGNRISLSDIPAGIYLIIMTTANGLRSERVVVE
ncbi:MAG: T9SS type A sorting domain-containing protein [Flavobacteriales bacterium]|nr:T9SS type A sorting domain-containing protein [Flavobacteriales bacterium]